jgi:hypothetical protein
VSAPAPRSLLLQSGRCCELIPVRVPLLRHYTAVCFRHGEPTDAEASEMYTIATRLGREESLARFGLRDAYTVIYSGHAACRARGWHLHLVLLRTRWAKAWLYVVLAGKNLLQALGARPDSRRMRARAMSN